MACHREAWDIVKAFNKRTPFGLPTEMLLSHSICHFQLKLTKSLIFWNGFCLRDGDVLIGSLLSESYIQSQLIGVPFQLRIRQ